MPSKQNLLEKLLKQLLSFNDSDFVDQIAPYQDLTFDRLLSGCLIVVKPPYVPNQMRQPALWIGSTGI